MIFWYLAQCRATKAKVESARKDGRCSLSQRLHANRV